MKRLLTITFVSLLLVAAAYALCPDCNGISVCGTDFCCNDDPSLKDSVCPSDFGDWGGCAGSACIDCDCDCDTFPPQLTVGAYVYPNVLVTRNGPDFNENILMNGNAVDVDCAGLIATPYRVNHADMGLNPDTNCADDGLPWSPAAWSAQPTHSFQGLPMHYYCIRLRVLDACGNVRNFYSANNIFFNYVVPVPPFPEFHLRDTAGGWDDEFDNDGNVMAYWEVGDIATTCQMDWDTAVWDPPFSPGNPIGGGLLSDTRWNTVDGRSAPEGLYTVTIRCLADDWGQATDTIIVDITPPTVTMTWPPAITNDPTFRVQADDDPALGRIAEIRYDIDTTGEVSVPIVPQANIIDEYITPILADGAHTIDYVQVWDAAGNSWQGGPSSFILDTLQPTLILILQPADNINIPDPQYCGQAADVTTKITGVTYTWQYESGPVNGPIAIPAQNPPYDSSIENFCFTLLTPLEGQYNVEIKALDEAGNEATLTDDFTYDLVPPTAWIYLGKDAVSDDTLYDNDGNVYATWGSQDADTCNIDWNWEFLSPDVGLSGASLSSALGWFWDNLVPANQGDKTIRLKCRDLAGNEVTNTDTIMLDWTPPEFDAMSGLTDNGCYQDADMDITIWLQGVSDPLSGMAQADFMMQCPSCPDPPAWNTDLDNTDGYQMTFQNLLPDYYDFLVNAVDNAGNIGDCSIDADNCVDQVYIYQDPDDSQPACVDCSGHAWAAGGAGDCTGELCITNCCGDDAQENYNWFRCGAGLCAPDLTVNTCCDLATDCVYDNAGSHECYVQGTQMDVTGTPDLEECYNGEWRESAIGRPCITADDCSGYYCVDIQDGAGLPGTDGIVDTCAPCDGDNPPGADPVPDDVCGILAQKKNGLNLDYGICTGTGSFYECYDQNPILNHQPASNDPASGLCEGGIDHNGDCCSDQATNCGGTTYMSEGNEWHVRCGPDAVCDGNAPMDWLGNALAGGECQDLDLNTQVNDIRDNDAFPDVISVLHTLEVETTVSTATAPDWDYLLYTHYLDRLPPGNPCNDKMYMGATCDPDDGSYTGSGTVGIATPLTLTHPKDLACDFRYSTNLPDVDPGLLTVWTGSDCDLHNSWPADTQDILDMPTADIVDCESDDEAKRVANAMDPEMLQCLSDIGLDCTANSFCDIDGSYTGSPGRAVHCSDEYDDSDECDASDVGPCCDRYAAVNGLPWEGLICGNDFCGGLTPRNDYTCCGDDIGMDNIVDTTTLLWRGGARLCCNDATDCSWSDPDNPTTENWCNSLGTEGDGLESGECNDGIDNDCDGNPALACGELGSGCDCDDLDCQDEIYCQCDTVVAQGSVWNNTVGNRLEHAEVRAIGPASFFAETDGTGHYDMDICELLTYTFIGSHPGFAPEEQMGIVAEVNPLNVDFTLKSAYSLCQEDCTMGDGICHSECDGWNLCSFANDETKEGCDMKQPGFWITDNVWPGLHARCCRGDFQVIPDPVKVNLESSHISNNIRLTRMVIVDGRPAKMIMDLVER